MNGLELVGMMACIVAFIAAVVAVIKFASWLMELAAEVRNNSTDIRRVIGDSNDRFRDQSARMWKIEEAYRKSADNAAEQLKGL
jgi:hypothetical protein